MATEYRNGLAYAMKRAHVDPAWLAKRVDIDLGQLEAWAENREIIPPKVAKRLAAYLGSSVADILFGLSYSPRDPMPPQ